ncbi:D-alanyl-D-alanine carboxypeptidase family protein [Alginatibacterium sediminis]|uniref:D-alanyl-D-alanine carboxypeptidase family protein n=1 Tax=Alginatibacterium sediminis TaxID=2164068 RepID=A0A420EBL4_9ALTE|nr:M15 family metallopeptidase [Alginatibacterium sediminis]RKF18061.1 D-alanyl-D-alanine carboxypeptidase family protein [Alginatibacterium sediminis]
MPVFDLSFEHVSGQLDGHLQAHESFGSLLGQTVLALQNMSNAAQADGLSMSVASGFRSFDKQLQIWNQKWSGQRPLLDAQSQTIDAAELNDEQKLLAILHWSALPGASRHHWGSDFDIYCPALVPPSEQLQLIPSEYQPGGHQYPLAQWLEQHSQSYGFFYPYQYFQGGVAQEPWHLSHREPSQSISENFELSRLKALIETSNILGKDCILSQFDMIAERFIFNICP